VEEAVPEYLEAFSRPGALRAGFDDYRASFPEDQDADNETFRAGARIEPPVLALWGAAGLVGQLPALEIWREYAKDVAGGPIPECGHFLPEEQPEVVADRILACLEGSSQGEGR